MTRPTNRKRARAITGRDVALDAGRSRRGALVAARFGDAVARNVSACARGRGIVTSCSNGACSIGRWPSVRTVNMREEYAAEGPGRHPERARCATRCSCGSTRASRASILLNRRGYATRSSAVSAPGTLECPNCSVTLTIHRTAPHARCHYCDHDCACRQRLREVRRRVSGVSRATGPSAIEAEVRAQMAAGACGAGRSRHRAPPRRHRAPAAALRAPRARHPDRHPDDRQGPRFPRGDARRRHLRRHRPRRRRFSRRRAHVPAADAGGRPRGPRRASG